MDEVEQQERCPRCGAEAERCTCDRPMDRGVRDTTDRAKKDDVVKERSCWNR